MMIRSSAILKHARGQNCTLRLPGTCNGNPETVVFCHLNGGAAGKGMGVKAHDSLGFFGCSDCHRAYDQQRGRADLALEVLDAVCETHVLLVRAGLISVREDKPKAPSERPVKPRKPKGERTPIHSRTDWPTGRKIQSRNNLRRKEKV
ncbi:nuclease domain-containing protein [Pelagibacterium lentulum]|uniref:DUF1364 domain-containing protein n=1 Tax=Pelagibacterium lentulum TaxID=2029865 RepID=A0A916R9B3_9HYPH|nr:nuclease domain-containing protein [Pelagibacterium lentulum]GGA45845.1 hypothetical protein GCM10011499_14480 [Pelagibacterium lentulum]